MALGVVIEPSSERAKRRYQLTSTWILFFIRSLSGLPLNQSTGHWYSTGSVSDLSLGKWLDPGAAGRSRSPYCTAACTVFGRSGASRTAACALDRRSE